MDKENIIKSRLIWYKIEFKFKFLTGSMYVTFVDENVICDESSTAPRC